MSEAARNQLADIGFPEQPAPPIPATAASPAPARTRLKDQPVEERPRERLLSQGVQALKSSELIAILLRTGLKGTNVVQVGEQMLQKFGSLLALAKASPEDLCGVPGVGRDKAATLVAAFGLARRMASEIRSEKPVIDSPQSAAEVIRDEMRVQSVETFWVLLLDTRRRLIHHFKIADGTLDTLLVHPREVFRTAIAQNASAIVLAHNHPSGDPSPSEADIKVTRDLIRAGQVLKIEVLDHVILGQRTEQRERDYASLKELGYFY